MAGASFEVKLNDRHVRQAFARLVHLAGSPDDLYRDWGEELLISTRARIKKGVTPSGAPFRPLNAEYAAWKRSKVGDRPILEFDLHMAGDQLTYQLDDNALLVGTNAKYGARHQFGFKRGGKQVTPARPWLGLSEDDQKSLRRILSDHLLDAIRRRI